MWIYIKNYCITWINLSMYLYDETYPSTYSAIQKFRVGKIFVLFLNVFESLSCLLCPPSLHSMIKNAVKTAMLWKYCYNLK